MNISGAERFALRDLHTDALSGKFLPATDPERRLHTMARLAVATCLKGVRLDTGRLTFEYPPSWAAGSYARVDMFKSGRPRSVLIADNAARTGSDEAVGAGFVSINTVSRGRELVVQDSTGVEMAGVLELGAKLDELQEDIATVAEDFYRRLQASQEAAKY